MAGAAKHGAFNHLDTIVTALNKAIAPFIRNSAFYSINVIEQSSGKGFDWFNAAFGIFINEAVESIHTLLLKDISEFPDTAIQYR